MSNDIGAISKYIMDDIASAIKQVSGNNKKIAPVDMATKILALSAGGSDSIDHEDLPSYVKNEALAVATRAKQYIKSDSIVFIAASDSHHIDSNANVVSSTTHFGYAVKSLAYCLPLDFCCFLGDYTAGSGTTTIAEGRSHFETMNASMNEGFRGIPQFRTVGNHDALGYSFGQNGEALTLAQLYEYIGSYNDDGTTVMGSYTSGYCYRDFNSKKLRVICLNSCDSEVSAQGSVEIAQPAQRLWFANTLISTPQDYGIVILCHHPLEYNGNLILFSNILHAYLDEISNFNIDGTTYNFSGKNKSAYALQFHGHIHAFTVDKLHYNNNGTATEYNAMRLAIPNVCFYRNNEYGQNGGNSYMGIQFAPTNATTYNKEANKANDTAFCVVVINPGDKYVHAICYGAGTDRHEYWGTNTVAVQSISFENNSGTVTVGQEFLLTPIFNPTNATNKNVTWSSSDASVASVSNGTVTAKAIGQCVITATSVDGGYTATYGLIVEAAKIEPTNVVPTSMTVKNPYEASDIYNSIGYKNNTKLGSGGGQDTAATGYVSTGVFHLPNPQNIEYIYVRGVDIDTNDSGCRYAIFGPNGTYESYGSASSGTWSNNWFDYVEKIGTLYYRIHCKTAFATSYLISKERYMRFSFKGTGEHLFVSLQNPIIDEYYPWGSTAYYTITNSLTHTTTSNQSTLIAEGANYSAILYAESGYSLDTVSVVMGSTNITQTAYDSSTHTITINNITGNITIIASSTYGVSYTNMVPTSTDASGNIYNGTGYRSGYRLNSSGAETESAASIVSGFIPYNKQVIRVAYFGGSSTISWGGNYICFYDSSKGVLGMGGNSNTTLDANKVWKYDPADETNQTIISRINNAAYIRVSISQYDTSKDFICTLNEAI